MMTPVFRKSFYISLLGHATVFGIFVMSFGQKIPVIESRTYFNGSILNKGDLQGRAYIRPDAKWIVFKKAGTTQFFKNEEHAVPVEPLYVKPASGLNIIKDKYVPLNDFDITPPAHKRKESVMMFYPAFPYSFSLYFKDRQLVHIGFIFNIPSSVRPNPIIVKRKVSSGNLEVDLVSMHYINHYLSVQRSRLPQNIWKDVKIELTRRND